MIMSDIADTEGASIQSLRRIVPWIAVSGVVCGAAIAATLIVRLFLLEPAIFREILQKQVRAMVGVPISAASAFCVVWLLEATSGRIEFEAIGFKFRGASGPVVLWVMCFLAFVLAIVLLWQ